MRYSKALKRACAAAPYVAIVALACALTSHLMPFWHWADTRAINRANQAYRYPYLLELFTESIRSGTLYPRWLPALKGGYGYPTFVFYGPGFWYAALPAMLLTGNAIFAYFSTIFLLLAAGGIGIYILCRLYCPRAVATALSAAFLLMPYLLEHIYVRGRLGETTAIVFMPYALYYMLRCHAAVNARARAAFYAAGWALANALVIYGHPFAAFWFALACLPVALCLLVQSARPAAFAAYAFAALTLTLALSCPYWLTILQLHEDAQVGHAMFSRFIDARQALDMSVGLPNAALTCLISFFCLLRAKPMPLAMAVLATLCLLLALQHLGAPLWALFPLLRYTQSPMRDNAVIIVLWPWAMALACAPFVYAGHYFRQALAAAVMMAAAIASCWGEFTPVPLMNYDNFAHYARNSWEDMTHTGEFLPQGANANHLPPRGAAPLISLVNCAGNDAVGKQALPEGMVLPPITSGARIEANVSVRATTCALIKQFYMTGWQVTVNEQPVQPQHTPSGLMRLPLAPGRYRIIAWYDGPPGWRMRDAAILLIALAASGGLWLLDRKSSPRH